MGDGRWVATQRAEADRPTAVQAVLHRAQCVPRRVRGVCRARAVRRTAAARLTAGRGCAPPARLRAAGLPTSRSRVLLPWHCFLGRYY